jgi:uncharacterized protein YegP (UPF0339 family)
MGPNLLSPMTTRAKKENLMFKSAAEMFTHRLSLIRALYIASVASNGPRDEVHDEFHQAVGDVLEGTALPNLKLLYIDKKKVIEEIAWLREQKQS